MYFKASCMAFTQELERQTDAGLLELKHCAVAAIATIQSFAFFTSDSGLISNTVMGFYPGVPSLIQSYLKCFIETRVEKGG